MRFDPQVEVVCDDCGANDHWSPEYLYSDISGSFGYYDTSDRAFEIWAKREGWTVEGAKTFCEMCAEEQNKPET
jgi:hypothetical protein